MISCYVAIPIYLFLLWKSGISCVTSGFLCSLLQALQRTLEFEDELAEKFGGGTQSREIGNEIEEIGRGGNSSSSASDIRKKYERKLAAHQESGNEVHTLKGWVGIAYPYDYAYLWLPNDHYVLVLYRQEKGGSKDLVVPGAGVCNNFISLSSNTGIR